MLPWLRTERPMAAVGWPDAEAGWARTPPEQKLRPLSIAAFLRARGKTADNNFP